MKKVRKMKNKILKMSMASKVLCGVLALVMVVSAVIYGLSGIEAKGEAAQTLADKTYLSDIVDRITEGKQRYFTILEIVPYAGMGELKYFAGAAEVEEGILSKSKSELQRFYNENGGAGKQNEWIKINSYFSNFGYEMKYNSYQDKYEIRCSQIFSNNVLIEPYRSLLEGKIRVKTVEANDLTESDIEEADLIILTATVQDNSTVEAYNYYTGNVNANGTAASTTGVYKKNGDSYVEFTTANSTTITYDSYEKIGDTYVSRDISWEMAKKLLDYMEKGRDLLGTGVYTQTPVIFSATLTEGGISKSSNMYKLSLIYRMLESTQYEDFINNHMSTVDSAGNKFLTSTGVETAAFCYETNVEPTTTVPQTTEEPTTTVSQETTSEDEEETSDTEETSSEEVTSDETTEEITTTSPLPLTSMVFMNEFTSQDIIAANVLNPNECIDSNPNAAKRVTNDYWVHNNDARMIPSNLATIITASSYKGLEERGLAGKTVADIVRYLLGCKDSYIPKYDYGKIKILEVEPCNSFNYDTFDKVKALANKMQINTSGWTSSNYTNYIEVTSVSTKTLNAMTTDLISTYDIILISDNVGMLTTMQATDSNGNTYRKPIYNDRHLDGYIYLAYGDITKLSSTLMGWMPWEYARYTGGFGNDTSATDLIYGGAQILNTEGNAWMLRVTKYPTQTRYPSYGWGNTGYVSGGAGEMDNQNRYNQMYTLSESTKRIWTDYQWDTLSSIFNSGDLLGTIDTADYYLNFNGYGKNPYIDMNIVFSDKIGNARFSDNDITAKTMRALKDYADSGKLMVFADSVYENDGSKIYPTSHLAELMNYVTSAGSDVNYLRESNLAGFITHINAMSPKLSFITVPTPVTYQNNSNGDQVIKMPDDYNRILQYAFTIDAYANTEYKVKLIIDKDGNGIYADTGKMITDDTNEIYKTLMVKTDANGHADVSFKTALADNHNGLIAYKVEVAQMDGDNETTLRSSYIGYTAVRALDVQEVKVLQIVPRSQYFYVNASLALDMAYQLNGMGNATANNGVFAQKLTAVNNGLVGYNINIYTMYTYEFENQFSVSNPYIKGQDYNTEKDFINANFFDMVILGFGDMYRGDDISNVHGALDCINDFIDNGNAVMFAHDTMSFNSSYNYIQIKGLSKNNANGTMQGSTVSTMLRFSKNIMNGGGTQQIDNSQMCTSITLFLRNSTGLDRYGVTLSVDDRDGKDKPVYANGLQMSYTSQSADGKYYVEELQGFSDWILLRQGLIRTYSNTNNQNGWYLVNTFNDPNFAIFNSTNNNFFNPCQTTVVDKVNEGQVTMFPYRMNDRVSISNTHPQYYQLDMEDDDLVVWYTLASYNNSGYFHSTRKDAQNNYYIYSKGNVTYTGAGHQDITSPEELKLFVNTIIKAIDSGNASPEVVVTNGALGSGIYNIYASLGEAYVLRFKATDQDLTTLETADGNLDNVGVFETGRVIWDRNGDGVYDEGYDVVMESYSRNGNKLYNDIVNTINIGTCPALASYQGEITGQIIADGTYFIIEATDMYGATGTARAKLTTRDLFEID